MNRNFARLIMLAAVALLALPAAASAAQPTFWGGNGFNDLGPASILMPVKNGKAAVTNVQLILACTDAEDGTESARAFTAQYRTYKPLRANRFSYDFEAASGGREGRVRITGALRSNGTGKARVRVEATARDAFGALIETCGGETTIALRRGR